MPELRRPVAFEGKADAGTGCHRLNVDHPEAVLLPLASTALALLNVELAFTSTVWGPAAPRLLGPRALQAPGRRGMARAAARPADCALLRSCRAC